MKEKQVPVIALDCDDVLVSTGHDLLARYRELYDIEVEPVHLYSHGSAQEIWGADPRTANRRIEQIIREERHERLLPDPRTIAAVRELGSFCLNHVVTSRSYERSAATQLLVDTHFSGSIQAVHFANSYDLSVDPRLRRTKSSICLDIGASIAVDDNYGHIEDEISNSNVELGILYGDTAWNRDVHIDSRVIRCETMDEVVAEVRRFASRFAA